MAGKLEDFFKRARTEVSRARRGGFSEEQTKRFRSLLSEDLEKRIKGLSDKERSRLSAFAGARKSFLDIGAQSYRFAKQVASETTTGVKESQYESLLAKSTSLLSGDEVATPERQTGLAQNVDKKKLNSLLGAIRARQGEVAARKGMTQTRTSILG